MWGEFFSKSERCINRLKNKAECFLIEMQQERLQGYWNNRSVLL